MQILEWEEKFLYLRNSLNERIVVMVERTVVSKKGHPA